MNTMTIGELKRLAARKGLTIERDGENRLIVENHPLAVPENAASETERRIAVAEFLRNMPNQL